MPLPLLPTPSLTREEGNFIDFLLLLFVVAEQDFTINYRHLVKDLRNDLAEKYCKSIIANIFNGLLINNAF